MIGIVLAAGKSERMSGAMNKCIKPLDGAGHTMLGRVISQLRSLDVAPVVVVGYQAKAVMKRYCAKATFVYNPDYESTGSLYSLWLALKIIYDVSDVVLASGSNIITAYTLRNMMRIEVPKGDNIAVMYPYPHGQAGARNIYHRVVTSVENGALRHDIAETAPRDECPEWCDESMAYSQFGIANRLYLLHHIPYVPGWRTASVGKALAGFQAMNVGVHDTLDVNTQADFRLAKEWFGYG